MHLHSISSGYTWTTTLKTTITAWAATANLYWEITGVNHVLRAPGVLINPFTFHINQKAYIQLPYPFCRWGHWKHLPNSLQAIHNRIIRFKTNSSTPTPPPPKKSTFWYWAQGLCAKASHLPLNNISKPDTKSWLSSFRPVPLHPHISRLAVSVSPLNSKYILSSSLLLLDPRPSLSLPIQNWHNLV